MKTSSRFAFRSNFEACKKVWDCKLRLTWPRPRAVDRCEAILFECMQPAMYRVSTGSTKPRSFHGALNQTKRLSTWQSVTPPIPSAGNQDIAFAAEIVRVPDPKRGLEMKFRSESPATFVSLLSWGENMMLKSNPLVVILKKMRKLAFRRVFCPT